MNNYYHSFSVGFNWYFVVGPLMALLMGAVGTMKYSLDHETMRIGKRSKSFDALLKILAGLLDAIFTAMVFHESITGFVQWLVNHVDGDPVWALFLAPMGFVAVALIAYYLLYMSGKIGGWAYHGYLIELRQELKRKERVKRLRDFEVEEIAPDSDIIRAKFSDFDPNMHEVVSEPEIIRVRFAGFDPDMDEVIYDPA